MTEYKLPDRYRDISDEEGQLWVDIWHKFSQVSAMRSAFEKQWDEIARIVMPAYAGTFTFGSYQMPGTKKGQEQIDSTAALALTRFGAICDSLLTPRNMKYQILTPSNRYLRKIRRVRLWFQQVTDILFEERYKYHSNFASQNQKNFLHLGAFGTMSMFVDEYDDPVTRKPGGIRYRSLSPGRVYLLENHQGLVDGFIIWYRRTALQAYKEFGPDRLPEALWPALKTNSQQQFDFLHHVCLRSDYDPDRLDYKSMPWASYHTSVQGKCIVKESGYSSFPLPTGRYVQYDEEVNGRSPAMIVLGSMKTLNSEKKTFLKSGHRASDPILLTADDGLADMASLRPGASISGAVNSDGRPLVHVLPTGEIQITKEMMDEERQIINDAFLVTLFQIMTETPQMTATEVIERTNEKGILLAPTVGRQQSEYIDPMTERELDILSRLGKLPSMPPELKEADGEYTVLATSPLAKAMRAQEAAGFMRTLENVRELVAITQDPSLLDPFDFDVAIPEIAAIQSVPESWMAPAAKIAAKRKARAQQQQRQEAIQAAPAQAAMMKAQVDAQKAQQSGMGMGSGALAPAPQGQPRFRGP
jgi:hypothetical protein